MDRPQISSFGVPPKNTYSNVQATTTYSTHEDIFKEAFKNIPSLHNEEEPESPSLRPPNPFDEGGGGGGKSVPGEDDGYDIAGLESPADEASGEYGDSPPASGPSHFVHHRPHSPSNRAYVAPHFDAPSPHRVNFNQRPAPVKYALQPPSKSSGGPTSYFGQVRESFELPAVDVANTFDERSGSSGGDRSEFAAHYSADYHHKPEKHKFKKGKGDSFKSDHHSSHGEKGDKGYKKYHDFDEGEEGHHGKEGKKGHHENESGYKKSHHHEGKKYGEGHGKHHGNKGVKYGETEAHNKGHKTSGYHNIFHKDEFKKEHKFYDDAHKHKHHDKHGGYHTDHGKKHGHKASSGFQDSDYHHGHKDDAGHYKKGHFDQDHKGHKGSSGHESHYAHHDDYDKKGGHSEKEKHGYKHSH